MVIPALRLRFLALVLAMGLMPPPNAPALFAPGSLRWQHEQAQGSSLSRESVTLWVVVRGKDGQLVTDLAKEDFRIVEDNKEQSIASSSQGDSQPLSLGLLLQWSGHRHDTLPTAEIAPASQLFRSVMRKNDAGFLAAFTGTVEFQTGYTDDSEVIARNLRRLASNELRGPSALYDALVWACRERFSARSGRKALVVVADGHDNASRRSLDDVVESARLVQVAIYIVDLSYADPYFSKSDRQRIVRSATDITEQAGGDIVFVRKREDLTGAFSRIAEELRSPYALVYYPTNAARDGKLRRIRVETRQKDLRVLGPSGYFASEK